MSYIGLKNSLFIPPGLVETGGSRLRAPYRLAFPHPLQALKAIENAMDLLTHAVSVTEEQF
jgi:hypothetical protein